MLFIVQMQTQCNKTPNKLYLFWLVPVIIKTFHVCINRSVRAVLGNHHQSSSSARLLYSVLIRFGAVCFHFFLLQKTTWNKMYMSNSPLNNQFPLDIWFVMIIFFKLMQRMVCKNQIILNSSSVASSKFQCKVVAGNKDWFGWEFDVLFSKFIKQIIYFTKCGSISRL